MPMPSCRRAPSCPFPKSIPALAVLLKRRQQQATARGKSKHLHLLGVLHCCCLPESLPGGKVNCTVISLHTHAGAAPLGFLALAWPLARREEATWLRARHTRRGLFATASLCSSSAHEESISALLTPLAVAFPGSAWRLVSSPPMATTAPARGGRERERGPDAATWQQAEPPSLSPRLIASSSSISHGRQGTPMDPSEERAWAACPPARPACACVLRCVRKE